MVDTRAASRTAVDRSAWVSMVMLTSNDIATRLAPWPTCTADGRLRATECLVPAVALQCSVLCRDRIQPSTGCVANCCRVARCSSSASRVFLSSHVIHRTYPIQKRMNEPIIICIVTQLSWPLIPAPCMRRTDARVNLFPGECLTDGWAAPLSRFPVPGVPCMRHGAR
jgi:hypothetical protein